MKAAVHAETRHDDNKLVPSVEGVPLSRLLPHDYLALLAQCNQVKCCLAEIDSDRSDVHVMILLYMLLAEIILWSG